MTAPTKAATAMKDFMLTVERDGLGDRKAIDLGGFERADDEGKRCTRG